MSKNQEADLKSLGQYLKSLRTRSGESLAEASGAVEIEVRELASIELGRKCPSEDVLLLLISHFGAQDDEAVKLWEMAGYGLNRISTSHMDNQMSAVTLPTSTDKILFTDIVDVVVNNFGVVMDFKQSSGPAATPQSVARVGMSREHAKSVMEILQTTLGQIEKHQDQHGQNEEKI